MSPQSGKRNLLALGAAAVLAVYTAGYARTEQAAEKFAEESSRRRSDRRPPAAEAPAPVVAAPTPAQAKAAPAKTSSSTKTKAPAKKQVAAKPAPTDTHTLEPTEIFAPKDTAPAPTPASPPPTPILAAPAPVLATAPKDTATTAPAVDSTRAVAWKDGRYASWGSSRHGDLEATVVIKDGRIISAEITQCYTRYPCSRISALPPQVVERQSENVDVVSRVTESSDAFFFAVRSALAKAKQ